MQAAGVLACLALCTSAASPLSFMASIRTSAHGPFVCGAALIAPRHVITAAHCINSTTAWVTVGGKHASGDDSEWRHAFRAVLHPQFDPYTRDFNVAIVELRYPSMQEPIPIHWTDDALIAPDVQATMQGFGLTPYNPPSSVLQEHPITIWDNDFCRVVNPDVLPTQFCVAGGHVPLCAGDEGGPLTVLKDGHPHLVGIGSFMVNCMTIPAIYTKMPYVRSFIEPFLAPDVNAVPDEDRPMKPPIHE